MTQIDLDNSVVASVISTKNGGVGVGTVLKQDYRLLAFKINRKNEILWKRSIGDGSYDYEGHYVTIYNDDHLICGCSEGKATEYGGENFKAYASRMDENGRKIWGRSYSISGNDCVYCALVVDDGFILCGTAGNSCTGTKVFLIKVDHDGNKLWDKTFSLGDDIIIAGLIKNDDGFTICGGRKDEGDWDLFLLYTDGRGNKLWDKYYNNMYVLDACDTEDGIIITGEMHTKKEAQQMCIIKVDKQGEIIWQNSRLEGRGIKILYEKNSFLIGGEIEDTKGSTPILYKLNSDGHCLWKRKYSERGWMEAMAALDYGYVLYIHCLEPKEHTVELKVDNDGKPI